MKFITIANDFDAILRIEELRKQGKRCEISATKGAWRVIVNYLEYVTASAEGQTLYEAFDRAYNAFLLAGGEA